LDIENNAYQLNTDGMDMNFDDAIHPSLEMCISLETTYFPIIKNLPRKQKKHWKKVLDKRTKDRAEADLIYKKNLEEYYNEIKKELCK